MNSVAPNLQPIIGRTIKSACSSLTCFTIALDDDNGLLINAVNSANPLQASVVPAGELPGQTEAVCPVDWGWIVGAVITDVSTSNGRLTLHLNPAGPLTVLTGSWQGSPYLAFQPYKPRKA